MEHPIFYHLSQCGCALGLGLGLSLWYDILRTWRRICPPLGWLFDLLLGLTFLPALWLFALAVGGGRFEFFFFPLAFLGWLTYDKGLRPWLSPCFFHIFGAIFQLLKKTWKKTAILQKKFFSFQEKWSTIVSKYKLKKRRGDDFHEI